MSIPGAIRGPAPELLSLLIALYDLNPPRYKGLAAPRTLAPASHASASCALALLASSTTGRSVKLTLAASHRGARSRFQQVLTKQETIRCHRQRKLLDQEPR